MQRPGNDLLAGATLAAQQHRRAGWSGLMDLGEDVLHALRNANHVVEPETAFQLLAQTPAFTDQLVALGQHRALQRKGLPHQTGRHGHQANVIIEAATRPLADPVDGDHPDHFLGDTDGHRRQGDALPVDMIKGARPVEEEGLGGKIVHHGRHAV